MSEANFDGLVGPSHHYAGLSDGNVASMANRGEVANPKAAALEGLEKMKELWEWGFLQGVFPPHERPHLPTLRRLGFSGSNDDVIKSAATQPRLLSACSSASAMWVANAATVSPSADTFDGRVHFTAANLTSKFHRAIEVDHTASMLRTIFPEGEFFAHHAPLPGVGAFADEGAANFMRLAISPTEPGIEVFVYGKAAFADGPAPSRFPARQTRESFEAIARNHGVRRPAFLHQNPAAIDAGVFHNDVIAVAHETLLFAHAEAFVGGVSATDFLMDEFPDLEREIVSSDQVSLEDTVTSYLFNSQIVGPADSRRLVAAQEVAENPRTAAYVADCVERGVFRDVHFAGLKQSMRNGGGPACLRLRVPLTESERNASHQGIWFSAELYQALRTWIEKHYRDRLELQDLGDPTFLNEVYAALEELTQILDLPDFYEFQRV